MRGVLIYIVLPFTLILSQFAAPLDHTTKIKAKPKTQKPTHAAHLLKMNSGDGLLVINEIDYDQVGTDNAEFIEIKNISASPVDLSVYSIILVDGASGSNYQTYPLTTVLNANDYYVLCGNAANVPNCDLLISPNQEWIQDGSPDGVILLNTNTGIIEDAISYEGSVTGVAEFSGVGLEDNPGVEQYGLSRAPDGSDTDVNNQDFTFQCITPGEANSDLAQPILDCPTDMVIFADEFCEADLTDLTGAVTVSDNCPANLVLTQSPAIGTELTPGTYSITITANDGSTPQVSCELAVSVVDTIPPVLEACPDEVNLIASPGDCFQNHSFVQTDFTGQFDPSNWNWNPSGSISTNFSFSGNTSVSLTASNDNGNSCPPPFFHTAFLTTTLPVGGLVVFNWSYETFDSSPLFDPFGFAINGSFFQLTQNTGPNAQSGSFSVPLDAGDMFSFLATSLDECNNPSVGTISNFVFYPGFQISENCPGTISIEGVRSDGLSLTENFPNCSTTVTWMVTDESGNTSTEVCETTVNVNDGVSPSAVCLPGPITIGLNSQGSAELLPEMLDAGSVDNCSDIVLSLVDPSGFGTQFDCNDLGQGVINYFLRVEDCTGNFNICSSSIELVDQVPPQWDVTMGALDMDFACAEDVSGYVTQVSNTLLSASDNAALCFNPMITIISDDTSATPEIPCSFTRTIVYRAEDGSGNSTGIAPGFPDYILTISVNDSIPPIFTTPDGSLDVSLSCDDNAGIAAAIANVPLVNDNCVANGVPTVVQIFDTITDNPTCPNEQTRVLGYQGVDGCGNLSIDTFLVVIETFDNTAPVFTEIPGNLDVVLDCDDSAGLTAALATLPVVQDNCTPIQDIQVNIVSDITTQEPGCPQGFTRIIEYEAVDECGNISTQNYQVTIIVQDNQPPQITANPVSLNVECNGSADPGGGFLNWLNNFGGLTATDNCSVITITMTDQNNVVVPRPLDDPGFNANAYLQNTLQGCSNTGIISMTFVASDECGNSDSRMASYSIQDNDLPQFTVSPADLTVQCDGSNDPGGAFSNWLSTFAGAVASDDCGQVTLTLDPPNPALPGFCGLSGSVTIDVVATDPCGNEVREPATFIIIDTEAPVITVPPADLVVECDGAGNVDDLNNWINSNGGAVATDNCGSIIWIANPGAPILTPGCAATGTVDVEFLAIDICGLMTSAGTASFTIIDTQSPMFVNPAADISVECDGTGFENQITSWLSGNGGAIASDECGTIAWSNDFDPANIIDACGNTGAVAVKFYAADPCSNVDSTLATFTLTDTSEPELMIPADIVASTDAGQCCMTPLPGTVSASVSDNCDPVVISEHSFDLINWFSGLDAADGPDGSGCYPLGTTMVYFRSTDVCLNQSLDSMSVTINDEEIPSLVCPANIVETTLSQLPPGDCSNIISWMTPDPMDNCPGVSMSDPVSDDPDLVFNINPVSGVVISEFGAGVTTISYTATDAVGNNAECSFTVTIIDNETPIILSCPNDIVYTLDGACNPPLGNIPDFSGQVQVLENCGYTVVQDPLPGLTWSSIPGITPAPGETVEVILSVADLSGTAALGGNTPDGSGCSITIAFNDINEPAIVCPSDTTIAVFPDDCMASDLPDFTSEAQVSDNCSQNITVAQVPPAGQFSTMPGDVLTVTLTATDESGAFESCSFSVAVADDTVPELTGCLSSITVEANVGPCAATVNLTPPAALDSCDGVVSVIPERSDGLSLTSPYQVGTTTVTWTAVDLSGNIDSCQTLVTVIDPQPPVALCDISVSAALTPAGVVEVCAESFDSGSFGICGTPVVLEIQITGSLLPPEPCLEFNCGDLLSSPIPITLFVSDGTGNASICLSTLNLQDNIDPVILSCPPSQSSIENEQGQCSSFVNIQPLFAEDNCTPIIEYSIDGGQIWTLGNDASDNYPVGTTTIDWRVRDDDGNELTCQTTVEVLDTELPEFIGFNASGCPGDFIVSTDTGECFATVNYTAPVGEDNCPGAVTSLLSGIGEGGEFLIGNHIEIYEVTDASGNTATCSFSITVEDNEAPNALCQDVQLVLNGTGQVSLMLSQVDNGSFDNCDLAPFLQLDMNSFDCSNLGSNLITLTVTDGAGNTGTCISEVVVTDPEPPTISCQTNPYQSNSSGDNLGDCAYVASNDEFDPASVADNCSFTLTHDYILAAFDSTLNGAIFPVGSTTVTWTISDASGNSASCSETIVIIDDEFPTCDAPIPVTVNISETGLSNCGASVILPPATASDNCAINFLINNSLFADSQGANASGNYPIGTTDIAWATMDVNGNSGSCFSSVTVVDDLLPIITCPADTMVLNDPDFCSALVTDVIASASDNCAVDRIDFEITFADNVTDTGTSTGQPNTAQVDAGTEFPVGISTIVFTAVDIYGNSAICSMNVTVQDGEQPVLTCPDDQVRGTSEDNILSDCRYTVQGMEFDPLGQADNCGVTDMFHDYAFGGTSLQTQIFNPGTTTVIWTVSDMAGNTSTCSFNVTIIDDEDPEIVCANSDVRNTSEDGNTTDCFYEVQGMEFDPVLNEDNCGVEAIQHNYDGGGSTLAGALLPIGDNPIIWTITDEHGNQTTCEVIVTVVDDQLPEISCPQDASRGTADDFLFLYDCFYTVQGNEFDPLLVNDNCPNLEVTHNFPGSPSQNTLAGANLPEGDNLIVWSITDENGNTVTCALTVSVSDNENPIAGCIGLIAFTLNEFGELTIPQSIIDNVISTISFDNCSGPLEATLSQSTFNCSDVGIVPITLTLTDAAGNSGFCSSQIDIQDNTIPECLAQDVTIQLDDSGNVILSPAEVDGGSQDACGLSGMAVTPNVFDCSNLGANPVTLSVTGVNGNINLCQASVTVEDITPPITQCQSLSIDLDETGQASITGEMVDNGSVDVCGIESLELDQFIFGCLDVGINQVVLTVTDFSGNASTCSTNVIVSDPTAPMASCQDFTLVLNEMGQGLLDPLSIDDGSQDACLVSEFLVTPSLFDCSAVGPVNPVVLMVTDSNGNSSTCTANVVVEDQTAPTAICQSVTIELDANGEGTVSAAEVDGGSTDACGIASIVLSQEVFGCDDVGDQEIILTVLDVNNNESTCSATVTIEDNISPVALCQNIVVELDSSGEADVTAGEIDNGSNDNCQIVSMTVTPPAFGCADIGINVVTLNVTDVNGNVSTCESFITIEDNSPPEAVCQDFTLYLNEAGFSTLDPLEVQGVVTDPCGITSVNVSPDFFTCNDVGDNTVVLTVADANGNVSICNSTVTVVDTLGPVVSCLDVTVSVNNGGVVTVTFSDINGGSADPCGLSGFSITDLATGGPTNYTCDEVGTTRDLVLTVTDNNGNTSSCTSNVTIEDNVSPVAVCLPNLVVTLDNNGNGVISAGDLDNGSSDNCTFLQASINQPLFNCADVGTNLVELLVTDASGNQNTCNTSVTVVDGTPPTALCQNIFVSLGPNGSVTVDPSMIDAGSNDECCIDSLSLSQDTFTFPGDYTVDLTVIDCGGNISSCAATVTVSPSITVNFCPDVFIQGSFNPFSLGPNDRMRNTLNLLGLLPLTPPYTGVPWFYNGPEFFPDQASIPDDMVDWIMLIVRDGDDPSIMLGMAAGVLHTDGSVTDVNGDNIAMAVNSTSGYFIELHHRGHLPVVSAEPQFPDQSGTVCYDFTLDMEAAFRNNFLNDDPMSGLFSIEGTFFGAIAGNVQTFDCQIDANDINLLFQSYNAIPYFGNEDVNMDGQVDANDVNLLFGNYNRNCHKPY
ncbi:MAG: HYR domain-containing protein [Bacteroidota bacterium]